ncbi:MAG TPA: porin [Allosphingosinicella sp.]|jgi:hypothetical protein
MLDLPPPDPGIEMVIASRGISKGLAQTEGPQVLVRPEAAFGPFHVGGYAKNVTSPSLDGEAGPVAGFRTSAGGFDLNGSATLKLAVAPVEPTDGEALELTVSASRRFGAATPRLSLTWSPDDLGSTGRSTYAEASAAWKLGGAVTLNAAYALRERDGGADYRAFNAGIAYRLADPLTAELRWYDTDRSGLGEPYRGRLVGSLRARF